MHSTPNIIAKIVYLFRVVDVWSRAFFIAL
jgi:hypothetical protein